MAILIQAILKYYQNRVYLGAKQTKYKSLITRLTGRLFHFNVKMK
ncbi:MAG: hypothetical protein ACLRQX_07200 [Turicibacter sanguinis]